MSAPADNASPSLARAAATRAALFLIFWLMISGWAPADLPVGLAAVMGATSGIRRMGSAALDLAYVAAGRYEGFWEFALSPWDIAAGLLLVREAGGYVSDMAGSHDMMSSGDVLAANSHLHLPLAALIKEAMRGGR